VQAVKKVAPCVGPLTMNKSNASSPGPRLDPRQIWQWTILAPFFSALMVFVVTVFDPFEFESATKHQSTNVFYKLYAALYPTINRDKITVVMLDDATLKKYDEPWPVSHIVHGDVLSTILSFEPAAVLVDMFFVHVREDDHFARTQAAIAQAKAPIFLVASNEWPPTRPEVFELERLKKVTLVSAEIEGEPNAPLYPLRENRRSKRPPAAVAVYRSVCAKLLASGCEPQQVPEANALQMEVAWGLEPAAFNCDRAAVNPDFEYLCDDIASTAPGRALQLLWQSIFPRRYRPTDPMPISYHATISAKDLLDGTKRETFAPLLKDRIVIYGAHISLVKDTIFSPVHGNIDGAYIHAMAIDNLLTFGRGYIRQGGGAETFRKEWTEFQPAIVMLVAALLITLNRFRLVRTTAIDDGGHALHEADERFLRGIRYGLIGLVTVAGILEFFIWSVSPFNWLALIIVIHVAHWIDRRFFGVVKRAVQKATMPTPVVTSVPAASV
jgi:CHASE2 domain-containing sensor protein